MCACVRIVRTEYIHMGRYYSYLRYLINSYFSIHLLCAVAKSLNIIFGIWIFFIKNVYTEGFFSRLKSKHLTYHEVMCDKNEMCA